MKLKLVIGGKNYQSWSLRPWIAMRHFNIPFDEITIPLHQPDTAQRIAGYSPSGQIPVLLADDMTIWDSIAILASLADFYPEKPFWPANIEAKLRGRSISAEMHSGFAELRKHCPMNFRREPRPCAGILPEAVQRDIARITEIWTDMINRFGGPYLCGKEFSIADAMYAPVVNRFYVYCLSEDRTVKYYMNTVMALPAWQEWQRAALAEPWRHAATDNLD